MKKAKFKDGDKVRLKKNLKVGKEYGEYKFELLDVMVFEGERKISTCSRTSCFIECFFYPYEMLVKIKP